MNEKFIPFSLSKTGLLVAMVAVFTVFTFLQYAVARCCKNPQWWKVLPRGVEGWMVGMTTIIGHGRRNTIQREADGEARLQSSGVV
jgi:hypothetical protein